MTTALLRGGAVALGLLALWQAIVAIAELPPYILPGPARVATVFAERWPLILSHALPTLIEIGLGLVLGVGLGAAAALAETSFGVARRWLFPVLVASQAVPVFALAPLLVLWLGYGLASKVAMATLIIFFPVTIAFADGLRRTDPGWLDLARTMGGGRRAVIRHVRIPAALPALASGVRVAAAVAPIGAVIGEWVGASRGLGYLMLHANARAQADLMFAALLTLTLIGLALYFGVDRALKRMVTWQPETTLTTE
jgi:putative hydroxymethylpyrimidine transport system permease protein